MSDLESVLEIARKAGREVMAVYDAGADAQGLSHKADDSPLTEADRRSHAVLVAELSRLTPDVPILSEEGAHVVRWSDLAWVVDPVDGTKEFVKRSGEFTVNIALVQGDRPILGVVLAPALDTAWIGAEGLGAQRIGPQGRRPIRTAVPASGALRVVASKDHAGPAVRAMLDRLPGATTLSMGSSLKFCLVAEGAADIYFRDGPTMEWDTAAAHAVLRAAGGDVFGLDGAPLSYGKAGFRNGQFVAVGDLGLNWRALVG